MTLGGERVLRVGCYHDPVDEGPGCRRFCSRIGCRSARDAQQQVCERVRLCTYACACASACAFVRVCGCEGRRV
eukprot:4654913-Alexandrium_andersonii.AAC.1